MPHYSKITLKPGKEQSVFRRHPWIFSGAIKTIEGNPEEGDLVKVSDSKGNYLATGHYQVGSIAVRILSLADIEIDYSFWLNKIRSAYQLRRTLQLTDTDQTNVYRLVNAEGDELPGLIIDFYNGTAVTQFHSIGMYCTKDKIIKALCEVYGSGLQSIYDKSEETIPFKSKVKPENGIIFGTASGNKITENGNHFLADWIEGQKTGFYIDQRDNRQLVKQYAADKKVLNMFGYTGGFSVYALAGNANTVHTVDGSKRAIELTHENVSLNFPGETRHEAFVADAFDFLEGIKGQYDLIILDPPAFAKHMSALKNALQGYRRLNQKALEQIRPGGIIFTFSCSQVVSKDDFRRSVFVAAANARRKVSVLHQLTQPPDHPVSIYHPEGEYLKGLVLYVE
jgi:23S rRNA (cytosine1962-C5)-methyltransferase